MNVTVPHKQRVMDFLSELDEDARAIGAVNTLVRTDEGYKGYNTDGAGFSRALAKAGIRIEGEHCLLMGAGGAAKAAAYVLAKGGAAKIHILNRNEARARELAGYINTLTGSGLAEALPLEGYRNLPVRKNGYLAVQSTSVGMHPHVCLLYTSWSLWGLTGNIPSLWGTSCLQMCTVPTGPVSTVFW